MYLVMYVRGGGGEHLDLSGYSKIFRISESESESDNESESESESESERDRYLDVEGSVVTFISHGEFPVNLTAKLTNCMQ